ncbi:ATM interactor [Papilio xuthus]|uniref:ATM interactor n=1 Tax=Papilio xuthus TaxID=66420 RepID=A0A0N1IN54_PAPXU|nr:ATM interactor [Papilio xuthus]
MTELNELNMDPTQVCRGCLNASGEMKNMIDYGLLEDFYKFSEVKVDKPDMLSGLLCSSCEEALMECRVFRLLCQQSDDVLKNAMKVQTTTVTEESQCNSIQFSFNNKKLIIKIIAPDMNSKIVLSCPYSCTQSFQKKPELLKHLLTRHQVGKDFKIDLQYYCSIENCTYSIDVLNNKYFSGRKFLNQHYNNVHKSKSINCDKCELTFPTKTAFERHLQTCNLTYECKSCHQVYKTNDRLLVHLMRKHPVIHKQYKIERKAEKRKLKTESKPEMEYFCDSPKRSFATQTLKPEDNIKNDITLPSWPEKSDETKTDEISTQTVFEDLLSLKSQASEDDTIYFCESVSDIQTQTFSKEFDLNTSNKETLTSETQSPDLSIKETQTCLCLYDSPKFNCKLFDSVSSSPVMNLTSTETQTANFGSIDAFLGFNTAETQTSFDEILDSEL